ncbi:NIPSNAP family protein [Rhizobiaceae sp. 2RAB30]
MIVEERIYTFHPGKVPTFMTEYETGPRELQCRVLGRMLAYFTSEFGEQNQTVHLWAYESLADRAERRARLAAEPEWRTFLAKVLPMILRQENRILTPTPFSPIGNERP